MLIQFPDGHVRDLLHEESFEDRAGRRFIIATYVISDIHGEYEMFLELLGEIGLRAEDTLYILGDVLDSIPIRRPPS